MEEPIIADTPEKIELVKRLYLRQALFLQVNGLPLPSNVARGPRTPLKVLKADYGISCHTALQGFKEAIRLVREQRAIVEEFET